MLSKRESSGPGFFRIISSSLFNRHFSGPAGSIPSQKLILSFRQDRRNQLLAHLRNSKDKPRDERLADYDEIINESIRLSGPSFNRAFELDKEPDTLRQNYGGEFGQRCLLVGGLLKEESAC